MINQSICAVLLIAGAIGVLFVGFLIASRKHARDLLSKIQSLEAQLYLERNRGMMEFIKKDHTHEILQTSRDIGRRMAADSEAPVLNRVFGGAK